jgi:plasmid replication initiation protein
MTQRCRLSSSIETQLVKEINKLSLNEQRLVTLTISQIKNPTFRTDNSELIVAALDIANIFDLSIDQAYEKLVDATSRLYHRTICINDKKTKTKQQCRWISYIKYDDQKKAICIEFSPPLILLLTLLETTDHVTSSNDTKPLVN